MSRGIHGSARWLVNLRAGGGGGTSASSQRGGEAQYMMRYAVFASFSCRDTRCCLCYTRCRLVDIRRDVMATPSQEAMKERASSSFFFENY